MPWKTPVSVDQGIWQQVIIPVEVLRHASKCHLLFPFFKKGHVFFIGLFYKLIPHSRRFLLPTTPHVFYPRLNSAPRLLCIFNGLPSLVKLLIKLFFVDVCIHLHCWLLPRAGCRARHYMLDDVIHVGLVRIFWRISVAKPASKFLAGDVANREFPVHMIQHNYSPPGAHNRFYYGSHFPALVPPRSEGQDHRRH